MSKIRDMQLDEEWFSNQINKFLKTDNTNRLKTDNSLIFKPKALVGIVNANDPIFEGYKQIIGQFHLTPIEAFKKYCEKKKIPSKNKDLTVISYILPINNDTKKENFNYSNKWPSERWAHTRLFGEAVNQNIQKFLVNKLNSLGILALTPANERYLFKVHRKHKKGVWASTWSHRHMAYAAGLGSFGLSDGFINKYGIAMRCGSIIVNEYVQETSEKRSENPYELCSKCGDCIDRCPVDAISFEIGHNKQKCSEHVMASIPYIKETFKLNIYACGLCQVGVSCENGIPIKQ